MSYLNDDICLLFYLLLLLCSTSTSLAASLHNKFMLKSLSLKTEFHSHDSYGDFSCSVLRNWKNWKNHPAVLKWPESDITRKHCKETIPKIRNKYSQKRNCTASVQFTQSFVCFCERLIYFQVRSTYSAAGKYVDRSWQYINRSKTHECGNWDCWDWGRTNPFLGKHKWNLRCSAGLDKYIRN